MTKRTATIIGGIGQSLIALGLCVLLFAGFQLWGTGLQTAAAQDDLETQFAAQLANVERLSSEITIPSTTTQTTASPVDETTGEGIDDGNDNGVIAAAVDDNAPPEVAGELAEALLPSTGESAGRIEIERIGVDKIYVEGVTRDALHDGPGHYPNTPLPGQAGNSAIAGHRTTYGSPFAAIDRLEPGDQIKITTTQGEFYYEVLPYENADGETVGHKIIHPTEVDVIEDQGDNRLTLTACHPKFSAAQRIIVSAKLVSAPGDPLPTTTTINPVPQDQLTSEDDLDEGSAIDEENAIGATNELEDSLGWHFEERNTVLLWGGLALLVAIGGAILGVKWRKWPAYVLTMVPFSPLLFMCFVHLDRLLPAF